MRTLFFVMLIAMTSMNVMFSSCSTDELLDTRSPKTDEISQIDVSELSCVQLQIDSLNQSMFSTSSSYETRGLRKFFKKVFGVIVSDAVGGLFGCLGGGPVGAAAGAVLASGVAAFSPAPTIANGNINNNLRNVNLTSTSLSPYIIPSTGINGSRITKEDSIGYYHNAILLDINNSLTSDELTFDKITWKVAEVTASNYNIPQNTIMNYLNSNRQLYENIKDEFAAIEYEDLHVVMDKWRRLYPNQTSQLNVLESFFNGIANLEVTENDGVYFNKVLNIIETSSLNNETKKNLRNAFIVGNASYQLWNTEE